MLQEELEVVSPAHFGQIPQEFTPVQCYCLDSGSLDGSHTRLYDSISCCESPKACICSSSLHAVIMMLLEYQVGVHPNFLPPSSFFVKLDKAITHCCLCS